MLVLKRKPFEEIWEYIEGHEKILILGCDSCIYSSSINGKEIVKALIEEIRDKLKGSEKSIEIVEMVVPRQCEIEYLKFINDIRKKISAIITLGCGIGLNLIADLYPGIEVYPGMNTMFYGAKLREGWYVEKCRACGDCIAGYTAGLCPITRCPKSMLNGPCGGSKDGVCEVKKDMPCVWYQIIKRLKNKGRLEKLMKILAPMDWRLAGGEGPREWRG